MVNINIGGSGLKIYHMEQEVRRLKMGIVMRDNLLGG